MNEESLNSIDANCNSKFIFPQILTRKYISRLLQQLEEDDGKIN